MCPPHIDNFCSQKTFKPVYACLRMFTQDSNSRFTPVYTGLRMFTDSSWRRAVAARDTKWVDTASIRHRPTGPASVPSPSCSAGNEPALSSRRSNHGGARSYAGPALYSCAEHIGGRPHSVPMLPSTPPPLQLPPADLPRSSIRNARRARSRGRAGGNRQVPSRSLGSTAAAHPPNVLAP
jgi:hypothetical protein